MATYEVLVSFILLVQLSLVRCGVWNDIFQFEEDLPLLWNNKLTTQHKCFAKQQDNSIAEGVCKTTADCLLTKGIPRGGCGLLTTCCTYERSCGRSSNSKISYFTSGRNILQNSDVPCSFNVIRANERVCQIRLDFIEFNIARPEIKPTGQATDWSYKCVQDNFYVTPTVTGQPEICGRNTGQHMYVHLSPNRPNISLNFKLASNDSYRQSWNIKVTQLECPGKHHLLNALDHDVVKDFEILAPPGCLQFFTKRSDYIMSFAYYISHSGADQRLASDQHYSICLKRPENTCGVDYELEYFKIEGTNCVPPNIGDNYLELPGTELTTNSKICGQNAGLLTVTPPGPLHMDFHVKSNRENGGFRLKYNIKSC